LVEHEEGSVAEKELRQEFEKWCNTASPGCSQWQLWQAAYAAGERAMRDKAVKTLDQEVKHSSYAAELQSAIRALPLSAQTEEIKK
jgi:hypothetical protein